MPCLCAVRNCEDLRRNQKSKLLSDFPCILYSQNISHHKLKIISLCDIQHKLSKKIAFSLHKIREQKLRYHKTSIASLSRHWDDVYMDRPPHEMSWYQQIPLESLALIKASLVPKHAPIIDIGGGDGTLIRFLWELGYTDLTMLDISMEAIQNARQQMGGDASSIHWVNCDILDFVSNQYFQLWHDRAVFHFLTQDDQISQYVQMASSMIKKDGLLIIATFSVEGPNQCSGLQVQQYDVQSLVDIFSPCFRLIDSKYALHTTPSGTDQHFVYTSFRKI